MVVRIGWIAALAALAGSGFAQEPAAPLPWPVELTWRVEPLRPYPGQAVDVVLRLEVPASFAAEQLIPRFRQPLDVHLELDLPFDAEAWDAEVWELPPPEAGPRLALDGERVRLERVPGETNLTLEHRTRWSFDAAGPRLLEPAIATGRWATSWSTDFLGQRTPADALEGRTTSRAFSFDVRPFPAEGRPPSFADAVGAFQTRLELSAAKLAVGEELTVAWTIAGAGNLASLTPPDFAALEDFHLLGIREEQSPGARTLRVDLRALDPRTRAFPSIPFAAFDPRGERYVDLATAPGSLVVTGDRALSKPGVPDAEPDDAPEPSDGGLLVRTLAASLAAAGALLLAVRQALRHPRMRHARALARFEAALARGEAPRRALERFAAERLDLGPFAPFDPRFEQRLIERGASAETARSWSEWIRADLAASYGGPREALDAPRALARRLHGELRAAART